MIPRAWWTITGAGVGIIRGFTCFTVAAPSTEVHGHHTGVAGSAVAMRAVLLNRLEQVGKVGCRPNLKYKGQGPLVTS